jgi:hypothetical protein
VTAEEAALERLRGKLHETLQKARVEEVDMPMIEDSAGSPSRRTRSGRQLAGESDEEEEEEESEERPSSSEPRTQESGRSGEMTQFSQDDNPKVIRDKNDAAKVDFSKMHRDLKQRLSDREERKVRKDFDDQRSKIDAEIEGMAPNMKVRESQSVLWTMLMLIDACFLFSTFCYPLFLLLLYFLY